MSSDMISFPCPQCGHALRAGAASAGKSGKCAKCSATFVVPFQIHDEPPNPEPTQQTPPAATPDVPHEIVPRTDTAPKSRSPLYVGAAVAVLGVICATLVFLPQNRTPSSNANPNEQPTQSAPVLVIAPTPAAKPASNTPATPVPDPPLQPQLSPEEAELARLRAERDRLQQAKKFQDAKAQLTKELATLQRSVNPQQTSDPSASAKSETQTKPTGPKSIAEVVSQCAPSVVVVRVTTADGQGNGAGFVAFDPTMIVTNYHVVTGMMSLHVDFLTSGGAQPFTCTARVIAVDANNDLALLKLDVAIPINAKPLEPANGETIQSGAEVVAIGNPGMGEKILNHTVSSGIISAVDRVVENRHFLQTTAAINPGNSGGPLLDRSGRVIGVVSAKAIGQENIGFAIPWSCVMALYNERESRFLVTGDFRAWEANVPVNALAKREDAIPVNGIAVDLYLDTTTKLIVALIPERNKVLIVDPSERKIVSELFIGTDPGSIRAAGPGMVWVSSLTSKNLTLINLKTKKADRTVSLSRVPVDFAISVSSIWYMDENGTLNQQPLQGGNDRQTTLNIRSLAYSGSKNRLLCGSSNGWLVEVDGDSLIALLGRQQQLQKDADELNRKVAKGLSVDDQFQALRRRGAELDQLINKCIKSHNKPAGVDLDFSQKRQTILFNSTGERIYFNCCAIYAKEPERTIGVFKNPEHSLRNKELTSFYQHYPYYRQIRAISPDGTLVSSGTHIFNTDDFTINQQLPVPTPAVTFSADSRSLYMTDFFNKQIINIPVRSAERTAKDNDATATKNEVKFPEQQDYLSKNHAVKGMRTRHDNLAQECANKLGESFYILDRYEGQKNPEKEMAVRKSNEEMDRKAKIAGAQYTQLRKELDALSLEIKDLELNLDQLVEKCTNANPTQECANWFLNDMQRDFVDMQKSYGSMTSQIETLKKAQERVEKERLDAWIESNRKQRNLSDTEVKAYSDRNAALEKQINALTKRANIMQARNTELETRISRLRTFIAKLNPTK